MLCYLHSIKLMNYL